MESQDKNNGNGNMPGNGWPKHEEYVMHELRSLRSDFKDHSRQDADNFKELQIGFTELKTKIAMWGAIIAGAASVAGPTISKLLEVVLR